MSFQLTYSIQSYYFSALRAKVANNLINNGVNQQTAYDHLYQYFPEDGNCWCFANKHFAPKGEPQDVYDELCKNFHQCLKCAELSDCSDPYNTNYTIDASLSSSFSYPGFAGGNLDTFDDVSDTMSVYSWDCNSQRLIKQAKQSRKWILPKV